MSESSGEPDKGLVHIAVDVNEPQVIVRGLIQTVTPITIEALNVNGHSDYKWYTAKGKLKEVERKTWGEVLASVDSVEEQMLRHIRAFPEAEHVLLLEGLVTDSPNGATVLKPARNSSIYVRGHSYRQPLSSIYAWLYQMSHYITIFPTLDMQGSAIALRAMFNSDQKESHATLQRNIVVNNFHVDPYVTMVMGMLKGVGEKRALELKKQFPTVYSLVTARPQDLVKVEGVGPRLAKQWCSLMGSPYA